MEEAFHQSVAIVILNEMKNLKTQSGCKQILHFVDKTEFRHW